MKRLALAAAIALALGAAIAVTSLALVAAIVAVATTQAFALDFTQQITQFDGSDLMGTDGKPTKLTLESVAENALLGTYNDEQNLSGEEKLKRYHLAMKIYDHKNDVELSAEELALVKRLIAKSYNTLVMGRAWELLDPPAIVVAPRAK